MKLTQKQERRIAAYLRALVKELGDVSPKSRGRALAEVKARILNAFRQIGRVPSDEDVETVLAKCGAPARLAAQFRVRSGASPSPTPPGENRIWLGVCSSLAGRFGWPPWVVRSVALVLGVTGPVSLLLYLTAYAEMYVTSDRENLPSIRKGKLAKFVLGALLAALAFYTGARLVLAGSLYVYKLYAPFTDRTFTSLGEWGWLHERASSLLFWVLFIVLPIAALSGLPVAGDWDRTGKKIIQAGLAVYALALSLGIACVLVGIILDVVQELSSQGVTLP